MNKRSILTAVLSLSLVGAISVGATMAYLTSKTETATNTFTVGSVNITQKEYEDASSKEWNSSDPHVIQPGVTTYKEPVVTVAGGSENCYVYMKVEIPDALEDLISSGKVSVQGLDSSKWKKVAEVDVNNPKKFTGIYQYVGTTDKIVKKSAADTKLDSLFTGLKPNAEATQIDLSDLGQNFNITVASFAIQADGHTLSTADQLKEWK